MKITKCTLFLLLMVSLSGCSAVADQNATLLSTKNGREQYAINGLVMVPKVYEGCTKPYIEKGMSAMCPSGLEYIEFVEGFNKSTIAGTWMQWRGIVECQ